MATVIPTPDVKLTTEAEIQARLESVRRQHNEIVNGPRREGVVHISTLNRRDAKIRKLYERMDALSDRLRIMRRKSKHAGQQVV